MPNHSDQDKLREWVEEKTAFFWTRYGTYLPFGQSFFVDFILSIVKKLQDDFWAKEQYLTDTIKELQRQIKQGKPVVDTKTLDACEDAIRDSVHRNQSWSGVVGILQDFFEDAGVKVKDKK